MSNGRILTSVFSTLGDDHELCIVIMFPQYYFRMAAWWYNMYEDTFYSVEYHEHNTIFNKDNMKIQEEFTK